MSEKPLPLKILTYGHPSLRIRCERVTRFDEELRGFAEVMFVTMAENDGVGLAASQLDRIIQLLVVNVPQEGSDEPIRMAVVNPEILDTRGSWDYEEGCLSVPELRDIVTRPEWIKLKYQDLDGREHVIEADGLLARVLQHEVDHLNGVLFVDRLSPVRRALMESKLKQLARENVQTCV
jgi:peptide deformylase